VAVNTVRSIRANRNLENNGEAGVVRGIRRVKGSPDAEIGPRLNFLPSLARDCGDWSASAA